MGLLAKIFNSDAKKKAYVPGVIGALNIGGVPFPATWSVDGPSLDSCGLIASAIDFVCRNVVGPALIELDAEGNRAPSNRGALIEAMFDSTKYPTLSFERAIQGIARDRILDGNAYLIPIRNGGPASPLVGLEYVPFGSVSITNDTEGRPAEYLVTEGGAMRKFQPLEVIHFAWGTDPQNKYKGISPLKRELRTVMTDSEIMTAMLAISHNVVPLGSIISLKGNGGMYPAEIEAMKESVKQATTGHRKGETLFLSAEASVQQFGTTPSSVALEKLAKYPAERILAAVGISATALGFTAGESGLISSDKLQAATDVAIQTYIDPLWQWMGRMFTRQVLSQMSGVKPGSGLRVTFDTSEVRALQDDVAALHKTAQESYTAGIVTRAEARAIVNLDSTPEDEVYFVQPSTPDMVPVDQITLDQAKAVLMRNRDKVIGSE